MRSRRRARAKARPWQRERHGERFWAIDFDDCGFSWYLYDFASAISFLEHEPYIPALLDAWIAGYRTVAPLADEDVGMIPAFIMLRRMLLTAWIASHSETPTARQLGAAYTDGTVRLARDYLAGRSTVGGSFTLARHRHRALSPVSHDG
jgi:Ser/Thr protein kinase RdoA (MazF antagonist)